MKLRTKGKPPRLTKKLLAEMTEGVTAPTVHPSNINYLPPTKGANMIQEFYCSEIKQSSSVLTESLPESPLIS